MSESLSLAIAQGWNGRNHTKLAAQFGLPRRCIFLAITMLHVERDWLLSLRQACVELSADQAERLAVLLGLWPVAPRAAADPISRKAAPAQPVGVAQQCLCHAQPGGTLQSTAQGPQL